MMPICDTREYRRIDIQNIEVRSQDDGQMIVEGYATTFNQPYTLYSAPDYTVREQVDPHAFDGADMSDVIMQYDHEGRVFARIRNHTLTLTPDEHGLRIRARLDGTELGRQLYEEIKGGYTDRMSFGFTVDKEQRVETEDAETGKIDVLRTIVAFRKIYDVSAVSLPANDQTEISARKLSDGLISEIEQERLAKQARARKIQIIKTLLEV